MHFYRANSKNILIHKRNYIYLLLFVLINVLSVIQVKAVTRQCTDNKDDSREAMSEFFGELDDNHDGQIDISEARKYITHNIGGSDFNNPTKVHHHIT